MTTKNKQRQRQKQIQGSLHYGGKSAAFGRDDEVVVD
jgi:hypothetical protein